MTADEIQAKISIDGATVSTSDTGGYHRIFVRRFHEGQRHTFSVRIPIDPSDGDLSSAEEDIDSWWNDVQRDQLA